MILYLTIVFTFFLPFEAYALPTPDVLVSLVNIVPIVTGTVVTVAGGAYYGVNRLLGPHASKFFLGGLLGIVILALVVSYTWSQNRKAERISQLAMYLRCDISAHSFSKERKKYGAANTMAMWREYGNFKIIYMSKVSSRLRKQPDATLVATDIRLIRHYSGIPTVKVKDKLYPFTHILPMELPRRLKAVQSKDLYLTDFSYINKIPSFYKTDKSIFKKFDNIYIVQYVGDRHRYVYDNSVLRRASKKNKLVDWPVEKERWILDEKAVYFPGMANLLTNKEVIQLLEKDDVFLLAPFGSYRRNHLVQKDYLRLLLHDVDKTRVLPVDMTGTSTSQRLSEIVKILDGSRFAVVGFTKHDWLYEGLDATYEIWKRLGQDPDRFRLIGFNTRLPEVIARRWEATARKSVFDVLRDPFWNIIKSMGDSLRLSTGAALFVFAVILRLILFPIGLLEACSRVKRTNIKYALRTAVKPLWGPSSETLSRHIKVSSFWELLGAFVTLLLVLPAYKILSNFPEGFQNSHFLWMDNLTKPDYLLSLFVGGLILLKLRLGNSSAKLLRQLLVTVAFIILLFYLPSSLLVYVSGVLIITILQDLIALRLTKKTMKRALLL